MSARPRTQHAMKEAIRRQSVSARPLTCASDHRVHSACNEAGNQRPRTCASDHRVLILMRKKGFDSSMMKLSSLYVLNELVRAPYLMERAISDHQWHSKWNSRSHQEAIKRQSRGNQEAIKRQSRGAHEVISTQSTSARTSRSQGAPRGNQHARKEAISMHSEAARTSRSRGSPRGDSCRVP